MLREGHVSTNLEIVLVQRSQEEQGLGGTPGTKQGYFLVISEEE